MHLRFPHRILQTIVACAGMATLMIACQDDELEGARKNGQIAFQVVNDWQAVARSGAESPADSVVRTKEKEIPFEINGQKLSMVVSEELNRDHVKPCIGPDTRGAAFDNSTHLIPQIYVTAICEDGNGGKTYIKDEQVAISGNKGASNHFWPSFPLSFFSYAWSKDNVTVAPAFVSDGTNYTGSFNYVLPVASTTSPKKDATNQPDVVFAISPQQSKNDPEVDLVFHHALSALVFKVGKMPENVTLKSIEIQNVHASGTCTMKAEASQNVLFTWTPTDGQTNDYVEELNQTAVEGDKMGNDEAIFMMLPQTMGNDTELVLNFAIASNEYTLNKNFNEILTQWEADKKYVFTIGLPNNIDVEITDQVEGLVKNNVKIQNTGIVTGYVRAAIVGYWVNEKGVIEAPWKETEGTFSWNSNWNTYWKKGTDGFYYHIAPVAGGADTQCPLFESYTVTEAARNSHPNQRLEISIVVQIIPEANKSLWPLLD